VVIDGDLCPVVVQWHDAHTEFDTWTPIEHINDDPCLVHTVGLLLPDVKKGHIVVAQSFYLNDEGGREIDGVLSIPVGMVQSLVVLSPMSENTSGRASR
jgi:hypothetical protein